MEVSAQPQPAHFTKHLSLLSYPFTNNYIFQLAQLDDGVSNGTALWLGGQCLAAYLSQFHSKFKFTHLLPRAIELGSGIGLTALALNSLGWDVVATDIHHVISSVLQTNIQNNTFATNNTSGRLQIRELDWTVPPDEWTWNNQAAIASHSEFLSPAAPPSDPLLGPPYDLIFSADTVYAAELVTPLLRTIQNLSVSSVSCSGRSPWVLLCIERRDPLLVDHLIGEARNVWHFSVEHVPRNKLSKCIERTGIQWGKSEWEGVELWKLRFIPEQR